MWTAGRSASAPPVLVVAEGWVLDGLAEDRLRFQLDRAGDTVGAIAARPGALAPGATYRSHAARQTLRPLASSLAPAEGSVEGAVLLRGGVQHALDGATISVSAGEASVLVDAGVHVHDPWAPAGSLAPAPPDARPPFARRPVVVFLGCDDDPDRAAWAGSLVNDLVGRDVEACLALPADPGGFQLARPCRADQRSIEALDPDVVVALDARATAAVTDWRAGDRHTIVIEVTDDPTLGVVLESWRLGHDRGRVRARAGQATEAGELARAINRLCSGPHPLPPLDRPDAPATSDELRDEVSAVMASIRPRRPSAERPQRPAIVVIDGSIDEQEGARLDGLIDQLEASGHPVDRRAAGGEAAGDLDRPGSLLLHRVPVTDELLSTIGQRRRAGRPTVVVVGDRDLDPEPGGEGGVLRSDAAAPAGAARMVVAPNREVADGIDDPATAVLVLPLLIPAALGATQPDRSDDDPDASLLAALSVNRFLGWLAAGLRRGC